MIESALRRCLRGTAMMGLFFGWMLASPFAHAGDAAAGADVFKSECSECHSPKQGKNKKGPSLFGIVGRPAGTAPGYNYTDALKQAHWTWTTDKLHWYLSQSAKTANPGTRMKYDGLDDPKQLDDLITYLGTQH